MKWRIGRPTLCRWMNSVAILELLRDRGPLSRAEIARHLGLNPASVTRIVDELLAKGLVLERTPKDPPRRGVGRPPSVITFNTQACLVAGVDLGGTFARTALLDLSGTILRRVSTRSEPGDAGFVALRDLLEELLASADPQGPQPGAIVIGVPGVVQPTQGVVVAAPALGWRHFPIKRRLEKHFGLPVIVENDVNLHALGEHWKGAGQGAAHLVCVFVGTGIGAGIIMNGELYRGATFCAGEIGYVVPDVTYLGQAFRGFGCLEHLAAGFGLAQRGREAILRGDGAGILARAGSLENLEAMHVLMAARDGDPTARRLVEEAQRFLALTLANITCVLNPETIVLGGGVVEAGVLDLPQIEAWVRLAVPEPPKIVVSSLGSDAGLLGAVALAMRSHDFLATLLNRTHVRAEEDLGKEGGES